MIREAIIGGIIEPGDRVVEGKWAAQLGVGQSSVREALNLLATEGLVRKGAGHSARVVKFSRDDVRQIYQVRISLEGLAARLIADRRPDLAPLDRQVEQMEASAASENVQSLIEHDLQFHLQMAELTGNQVLLEHLRRLLVPLFAFVAIRVNTNNRGLNPWTQTLALHRKIVQTLRLGDPVVADTFVQWTTRQFGEAHSTTGKISRYQQGRTRKPKLDCGREKIALVIGSASPQITVGSMTLR